MSCYACNNTGMLGGELSGPNKRKWEWCDCFAAQGRRSREPNLVEASNVARDKILALEKVVDAIEPRRSPEEIYRGEF